MKIVTYDSTGKVSFDSEWPALVLSNVVTVPVAEVWNPPHGEPNEIFIAAVKNGIGYRLRFLTDTKPTPVNGYGIEVFSDSQLVFSSNTKMLGVSEVIHVIESNVSAVSVPFPAGGIIGMLVMQKNYRGFASGLTYVGADEWRYVWNSETVSPYISGSSIRFRIETSKTTQYTYGKPSNPPTIQPQTTPPSLRGLLADVSPYLP